MLHFKILVNCSWESCSETCGLGNKTRSRQISVNAEYGGVNCTGTSAESTLCKDKECPGMPV